MDSNEGIIEDVNDDDFKPFTNAETSSFSPLSYFSLIISFVEANGWFILIGCILLYFLYNKFKNNFSSNSRPSLSHRDVDEEKELRRLQAIEAVRQRQQAALDAAAAKYLEEKKLKEERLAKEKAEEWEKHQQGLGYHSKTKKQEDDLSALGLSQRNKLPAKPKLRGDDYNPLTGQSSSSNKDDGASCSYRPGKRGGTRGG